VSLISSNFIPAKIHTKEQPQVFKRFGVQWTPTILVMTPDGAEAHRIDGFLPVDDLLAQLTLGLGKVAFKREQYPEAERHFREVVDRFGQASSASEAAYWAGVSAYKATHDGAKLKETYRLMQEKYPASEWARKAQVWAG
jgi:thioredoxin-like negative regulator of GroEL